MTEVPRPTLKQRNRPIIRSYVASVVTVFLVMVGVQSLPDLKAAVLTAGDAEGSWRLVVPLLSSGLYLFLVQLVPTEWKEILVFWRLDERLPGHRAFSVIAGKDPRVSLPTLRERHGPLPSDGEKQNALWYDMSGVHAEAPGVEDAHKSYLLYRELTYLNVAVGLVLALPSALLGLISWQVLLVVLVTVVMTTAALARSGQNAALRMVQNVLAAESRRTPTRAADPPA